MKRRRRMSIFPKPLVVSKHARERYHARFTHNHKRNGAIKDILSDLDSKSVKKIERLTDGESGYRVYTRGNRQYIILDIGDKMVIKTLIQHNKFSNPTSEEYDHSYAKQFY